MKTAADIFKSAQARQEEKKKAEEEAAKKKKEGVAASATQKAEKQAAAVKDLKKNVVPYLEITREKAGDDAEEAQAFATELIKDLAGGPLPKNLATQLFDVYDDKSDEAERSKASTGWLRALGLIEEED